MSSPFHKKGRSMFSAMVFVFLLASSAFVVFFSAPQAGAAAADQATATTNPARSAASSVAPTPMAGYKLAGTLASSADVYVVVGIPLRNLGALESVTQEISDPGSPQYHHFLTQSQVAAEFLPTTTQFKQALSFLDANGFRVMMDSLNSIIVAQGTVSQASRSLGLSFDVYTNGSSRYYSAYGSSSALAGDYVYSSNVTALLLQQPTSLVMGDGALSALRSGSASVPNQTAPLEGYSLKDLRSVYNATSLYTKGDTGAGYTAGILDFFGDPYISQQLQYFDQAYGLPSAQFKVIPVGPYNPGLGTAYAGGGWADEISLDVESVHAMAPGAGIDLYIADNALPLAAAIAPIVQQESVNDLSQSFSIPESTIATPVYGASGLELNVILTDQYYLLGSAEGITFMSSTGDEGGSGFSGGPAGTAGYPSTSPYVVAVGGTTTYVTFSGSQVSSSYQTAWSNYGFVANQTNYGGSTGGVSVLEPKPWYQSTIATPATYTSGRMVPDISLNANVYPGVAIVLPGNITEISGGTSESSPLLAGLLTLLMQSSKGGLGLINPSLYALGGNSSYSSKVYDPITFGYNTPWVATSGYNLVTGLGAPNVGALAQYGVGAAVHGSGLNVNVSISSSNGTAQFEYAAGQGVTVSANITDAGTGAPITDGTFVARLETLAGTSAVAPLTFVNGSAGGGGWSGTVTVPGNASGISFMTVAGSSASGLSGTGFTELFSGYLATFISPTYDEPYASDFGTGLIVNITTLAGAPVTSGAFSLDISSYSLQRNSYTNLVTVPLSYGPLPHIGKVWSAVLNGSYAAGPMLLSADGGVYGYLPFINGVSLESMFILPSVIAEPGAVGPGQSIFILGSLTPPLNTPAATSLETGLPVADDIATGSNVTAALVSQSGEQVALAHLYSNDFVSPTQQIQGYLQVPNGTQPGLYNVFLNSSFDSYTLNATVTGSYFGQIYVASASSVPRITVSPSPIYEGETATISAKIAYPNGTSVDYGMYSAALYPKALQNYYPSLTQTIQVPLWYNAKSGLWTGNATLPSAYNGGGAVSIDPGALYLDGPYDVYVSGVSADGVPTTTDISAQQGFFVQPYTYLGGQHLASISQTTQVAFVNDTISTPADLSGDVFVGSNTIQGATVTVTSSQINGTLTVKNGHLELIGVTGGDIVAQNSTLVLRDSNIDSLRLSHSVVSMNSSSYLQVNPSLPSVEVEDPAPGQSYDGMLGVVIDTTGQQLSSLSLFLDGKPLTSFAAGSLSSYAYQLNTSSISNGVHELRVVATQQDGLSSSSSVSFNTDNLKPAQAGSATTATATGAATSSPSSGPGSPRGGSSSDGSIVGLANALDGFIALAAVAVVVVALMAVGRRREGDGKDGGAAAVPQPSSQPVEQAVDADSVA